MKPPRQPFAIPPLLRAVTAAVLLFSAPALMTPVVLHAQNLPNLGGTDGEELSPQQERKLGEQVMRGIKRDRDYLDDPVVMEYLNNFGAGLLTATPEARGDAGYDYLFFAVRDPVLNAFALPGGFIGVHSGLVLAAQSESELASVLAHEIGHVSQRHIARMLGNQRQTSLLPLAGILLAALVARSSPDLASAAMMGGTGIAVQRQLSFTRDAEREADRIGLQLLRDAGFDATGMVQFFARLQSAGRNIRDTAPAYLRTHPLTTERIADIEARIRNERYRQHADSFDFYLVKARLRVLQDDTAQGWRDAGQFFNEQLRQGAVLPSLAAYYGLAHLALRQGYPARAASLLKELRANIDSHPGLRTTPAISALSIGIKLAARDAAAALQEADAARMQYPLSRTIAILYPDSLMAAGKQDEAIVFLRDQAQLYRQDAKIQQALARAYAAQGKQALQHIALAEYYNLSGSLPAALEQLRIARASKDVSFYDEAIIDARERELQAAWREMLKAQEKPR